MNFITIVLGVVATIVSIIPIYFAIKKIRQHKREEKELYQYLRKKEGAIQIMFNKIETEFESLKKKGFLTSEEAEYEFHKKKLELLEKYISKISKKDKLEEIDEIINHHSKKARFNYVEKVMVNSGIELDKFRTLAHN